MGDTEGFLARSAEASSRQRRGRMIGWLLLLAMLYLAFLGRGVATRGLAMESVRIRYLWVQLLPDEIPIANARLVRAIVTEGDRCPRITRNREPLDMEPRLPTVRAAFPILLCEIKLDGSSTAYLGSILLPTRSDNPTHVIGIGDTGCRMVHWQIQSCLSGVEWPFAAVASSAAKTIDQYKSQTIIVHVGDYHYRENPCADVSPECGGSPFGDNWATWEEEFFKPAAPLLLAAPWVMVRGNHENCNRAGAGWLFFFALPGQRKTQNACESDLTSYSLNIGQTADGRARRLVVLDTAYDDNTYDIEKRCRTYAEWLDELRPSGAEIWLTLHQPLWMRNSDGSANTDKASEACKNGTTKSALNVMRARFDSAAPTRLARLVLSGDVHLFQFFQPSDEFMPVQAVVGNGGTKLDDLKSLAAGVGARTRQSDLSSEVDSFGVKGAALSIARHGFTTFSLVGSTWTMSPFDASGKIMASCRFSEAPTSSPSAARPDCSTRPEG